jgi:DNA oxidative demethylase
VCFRIGNTENRGRPYTDLVLDSGDLVVFGRENRLACHGVPRMVPSFATEDIGLPEGRINITLRVSGLQD